MGQEVPETERCPLRCADAKTGVVVNHLQNDAAGVAADQWIFVVVILVSSLLNAIYFFNVLERIYLRRAEPTEDAAVQNDGSATSTPVQEAPAFSGGGVDDAPQPEVRSRWNEAPLAMLIPTLILAAGILIAGLANAWIVEGILRKALPMGL